MAVCAECKANLKDAGEYHPYAFCVLYKAGLDPWQEVRGIAGQLGLGDPGAKPPLVVRRARERRGVANRRGSAVRLSSRATRPSGADTSAAAARGMSERGPA